MYLIALTRWGSSGQASTELLATEVSALGPVLGKTAYELRLALSAPLPLVLLETADAAQARALVGALRGRGHGAVACDAASIAASSDMHQPKSFAFEAEAVVLESPGAPLARMAHSEVLALILATHARDEESSREKSEKKLSLARAALTGGLVRSKTTTKTEREVTRESERVLYLLHRSGAGHALLRETRLHYTGLGSRMGKSAAESFTTLVGALRQALPAARFDDRLLRQRAGTSLQVSRGAGARTVTTSNASAVDLAVHLLAVAFLQGQA